MLAGSGQAAAAIAKRYGTVIAQDASAEQLSAAGPRGTNISFQVARAEATGQPDASFDLVTVAEALHWCGPALNPMFMDRTAAGPRSSCYALWLGPPVLGAAVNAIPM